MTITERYRELVACWKGVSTSPAINLNKDFTDCEDDGQGDVGALFSELCYDDHVTMDVALRKEGLIVIPLTCYEEHGETPEPGPSIIEGLTKNGWREFAVKSDVNHIYSTGGSDFTAGRSVILVKHGHLAVHLVYWEGCNMKDRPTVVQFTQIGELSA
jgi:hypothetical protein